MPLFQHHPVQDTRGVLGHNDTLYVLFDGPSRVFVHTEHESRMFCNVWLFNGFLVFRGWHHATYLMAFSLKYFQIVLEYLKERNLFEFLVCDIFYGIMNGQWCTIATTPTPVPN